MIRKVLIANRGEIAVRIVRALREAGIASIAVYSDADRRSLHVRLADEAVHVGPAASSESYLNIPRILNAARERAADAVHPGYGFLSENAEFAAACETAGLIFIGPSSDSIRMMGSKTRARKVAAEAKVPVVPGTTDAISDPAEALRVATEIGFPVMIKAAAGGGGKGMRSVRTETELHAALRDAASEAQRSFGNGEVYIEKLLERPRHIEIQVLGDRSGHIVHLGERECSVQRRHQKVVEECPSPLMTEYPELRHRMGEAAVQIGKAAGYHNVGTVEFLVDNQQNFYFLEMNTRLQVEHPVTELVTGIDLVQWQLRIADGKPLTLSQEHIHWRGHAVECRLYAEDPDNNFFPSPGEITAVALPSGPGVRLDSTITLPHIIPLEYDPLLAKLAVHAETRDAALARMRRAVAETYIGGIKTNVSFFSELFLDEEFCAGRLHTGLLSEFLARRERNSSDPKFQQVAALVALAASRRQQRQSLSPADSSSRWLRDGRLQLLR